MKVLCEAIHQSLAIVTYRAMLCRAYHRMSSTGADALHTPASRGIAGPATISRSHLAALCMQILPRGIMEVGHGLTGLHEDSDGVTLLFQVAPLSNLQRQLVGPCAQSPHGGVILRSERCHA